MLLGLLSLRDLRQKDNTCHSEVLACLATLVSIIRVAVDLLHNHEIVNVLLNNFEIVKIPWDEGHSATVNAFTDTDALYCLFSNFIDRNDGLHESKNVSNLYCFTANSMFSAGTTVGV
jgi:hypothetical protein